MNIILKSKRIVREYEIIKINKKGINNISLKLLSVFYCPFFHPPDTKKSSYKNLTIFTRTFFMVGVVGFEPLRPLPFVSLTSALYRIDEDSKAPLRRFSSLIKFLIALCSRESIIQIKNSDQKFSSKTSRQSFYGGCCRIRTYDPLLVRQMLSPTELNTQDAISNGARGRI